MRALWQMPELQEIWNHIETGETPVTVTGLGLPCGATGRWFSE